MSAPRAAFESHLPSDNPPILRGIFAYGGFDAKTTEMVNAYNETATHHPVLLLAPDNSNSYWNVVSSRLSIRLKQAALAEEQRWALEMWTCQERQEAVERQLRVQQEGEEGDREAEDRRIHEMEEELKKLKTRRRIRETQ